MSVSHRDKQRFFDSLARLVRSGITIPAALEKLSGPAVSSLRPAVNSMRKSLAAGMSVSEAFQREEQALGTMEASVLGAAERTGRLDQVLHQLADYHGALAEARAQVRTKLIYPAFLFHFAVLLMSLPRLLPKSELSTEPAHVEHGLTAYVWATLGTFAFVYFAAFLIWKISQVLARAGARNATVDRLLNVLPLIGAIRHGFALNRFCLTYELHLSAGVNTFDALETAALASQSGIVRRAVSRALPEIHSGSGVGDALAEGGELPSELIEGLLVGEESGQLDQTLVRLASAYQTEGVQALATLADWLPRLIYLAVVAYTVYLIFRTLMHSYFGPLQKLLEMTG